MCRSQLVGAPSQRTLFIHSFVFFNAPYVKGIILPVKEKDVTDVDLDGGAKMFPYEKVDHLYIYKVRFHRMVE